jgi:uncharacterized protein DUF4402
MLRKFCSKSIVLSNIMFVLCFVCNASAATFTTNATVVGSVTVAEVTPLDFGSFVPDPGGDTITFNAGGTISAAGASVLLGGEIGGVVSTNNQAITDNVQVFVTGGLITSGGNNMTVQLNCMGPNAGVLGTLDGSCTFVSPAGSPDNVQIGGVLTYGAAQPAGAYTGLLTVTAGFF